MIRAIIPCAGFGTRMSMPINQSKELLLDKNGQPLIQWHLDLCKQYNIEPFIVTRAEKEDLIDYCKNNNIAYAVMVPGEEWPHTAYNSNTYWKEKNILLLPDSRFEPKNIINQIKQSLEFGYDVTFAVHKVPDVSKWGMVTQTFYSEKPYLENLAGYAWGIIGFTKQAGYDIFYNMRNRGRYSQHEYNTNIVFLDSFRDVTRTGVIEE